jgi:chemotaxis response regulator CheB/chemotaxis methyl-accepting protein methylase
MIENEWNELIHLAIDIARIETGIELTEKNHVMLKSRLSKRLYSLKITSPHEYVTYFKKNRAEETKHIVSLITTHFTSFFREYFHFEELEKKYISKIVASKKDNDKVIRIWSAACSEGQECYSMSMFFHKLKQNRSLGNCTYEILGTDIDEKSVNYGKNGIYLYKDLVHSPIAYIHGNWSRGKNEIKEYVKPKTHIRSPISFKVDNLLHPQMKDPKNKFDIIFCRNVLIYFNTVQVGIIIKNLLNCLAENGILVLGLSESVYGLDLPITALTGNIFCHNSTQIFQTGQEEAKKVAKKEPWKIMCVDDSPTVLTLLKRILIKEHGFEVVATAASAAEARSKLRNTKIDLMTLDIQMDKETGIDYLRTDFVENVHPPVVILSSHDRDGNDVAKLALELGASDYIEKPAMANLDRSSDEIRFKIQTILNSDKKTHKIVRTPQKNSSTETVRVLIVDDSPSMRFQLKSMISKSPRIEVIGEIGDPRLIEGALADLKPEVMLLDINMPHMSGIEVVQKVSLRSQTAIILTSSLSAREGAQVIEALEHGAVDYFPKPKAEDIQHESVVLIEKIIHAKNAKWEKKKRILEKKHFEKKTMQEDYLIALGASTGGTEAILEVLKGLPNQIPPVVVVQHIPAGFSTAFADRLNQHLPFSVQEARHNQIIEKNEVYIAPGDRHMEVVRTDQGELKLHLSNKDKCNGHRPSVDILFESIAKCQLKKVIGVILTGMGSDGAKGLKKIKEAGGKTIAQNEETSVVFGMPKEAILNKAAIYVEPLEDISSKIMSLSAKDRSSL